MPIYLATTMKFVQNWTSFCFIHILIYTSFTVLYGYTIDEIKLMHMPIYVSKLLEHIVDNLSKKSV